MQNFMIKNAQGIKRDMVAGAKAAKFAKSFFKTPASNIIFFNVFCENGCDIYWCKSVEANYFRELLIKEEKQIIAEGNAQNVIDKDKEQRAPKAPDNAARCRHAHFGEGSIVSENEKSATVLFDNQKKAKKMLLTAIERI